MWRAKDPEKYSAYIRAWNIKNADRIRELDLLRRQEAKDYIIERKKCPCVDCGESYPSYVMDFDHVRGRKIANIASGRFHSSMKGLKREMAKCDVVCANCHREREHQRRQDEQGMRGFGK